MKNELRENLKSILSQLIELRQSLHQKHDEVEQEYDKAFDVCPTSSETRYFCLLKVLCVLLKEPCAVQSSI